MCKGVARGGSGGSDEPPSADKSGWGWHERCALIRITILGAKILILCTHCRLGKMPNHGELALLTFFLLVSKTGKEKMEPPL